VRVRKIISLGFINAPLSVQQAWTPIRSEIKGILENKKSSTKRGKPHEAAAGEAPT